MNTVGNSPEAQKQLAHHKSRQAATEGIVLLKNSDSILPLQASDTVSLFGSLARLIPTEVAQDLVERWMSLIQLMHYRACRESNINLNLSLVEVYQRWVKDNPFNDSGGGWAAEPWFQRWNASFSFCCDGCRRQI